MIFFKDCGEPHRAHPDIKSDDFNVDIQQQPWMVSLGQYLTPNKWEHQCGGSLITRLTSHISIAMSLQALKSRTY
jgi:hypothetical protein